MAKGLIGAQSMGMDYQAEDDLRTLSRAQMIKNDPKRFKAAMKLAKTQIEALEDLDPAADAKEDAAEGEKDD